MTQYSTITRGTTPTHTFSIPIDADTIEEARIIYAQNDIEVFRKETFECVITDNQITTTLTQADTLALNHKCNVEIQCQFKTTDGNVYSSIPVVLKVLKSLTNEEI